MIIYAFKSDIVIPFNERKSFVHQHCITIADTNLSCSKSHNAKIVTCDRTGPSTEIALYLRWFSRATITCDCEPCTIHVPRLVPKSVQRLLRQLHWPNLTTVMVYCVEPLQPILTNYKRCKLIRQGSLMRIRQITNHPCFGHLKLATSQTADNLQSCINYNYHLQSLFPQFTALSLDVLRFLSMLLWGQFDKTSYNLTM